MELVESKAMETFRSPKIAVLRSSRLTVHHIFRLLLLVLFLLLVIIFPCHLLVFLLVLFLFLFFFLSLSKAVQYIESE